MTARSALHAVVQHASDADEAEFNRRLDAYAAEVRGAALQDAKAETVAWLAKKAGEHRARGRQYAKQADVISVLASKADRGAIRCFLGDAPLLREVAAERDRARRIAVALEQEVAELTRRLAEVRAEVLRVATAIDGIDFHPRAVVRSLEAAADLARRLRRLADDTDVEPCDDCPGRPDCRCADGHADPTTCTCGTPGGDS
ncbi:hypothetical protein [Streptomyces diastaticus]|uniref:hypothetical protein n=1 Tax=Streptomyces diastaticus TaxID=1956 RepID=UPI0035DDD0FB